VSWHARPVLHEHEAPQPVAEPAAPANASAPVAAAGLVGMPAVALSLHRSMGNRLVSRALATIARDVAAPAEEAAPVEAVNQPAAALSDEAVPLDNSKAPAAASTGPAPTFDHSGGSTVTINADSAVDFANNIVASIGAPHVEPELTPAIEFSVSPTGAKKITSIGLTVKTSIVKVRWGMGRVDAENKAMIDQMVAEIKAHEQRHRAIIESAATDALAKAQKFVGTGSVDAANTALTKTVECTMNKGHEALDGTEGKLTVSEARQPDGTIKLSLSKSGSGAKYPCSK
jgi:hypothetical protein